MQVADAEGAATGGPLPAGSHRGGERRNASPARARVVGRTVFVKRAVRTLASSLPFELRAETLGLALAQAFGLVATDIRRRNRAGLVGPGQNVHVKPTHRNFRPGQLGIRHSRNLFEPTSGPEDAPGD